LELVSALVPWHNVRLVGEDIVQGEMIVASGRKLTAFDVGALLAAGLTEVRVRRRPRVALLPTGDEIVEPGSPAAVAGQPGDIIGRLGELLVHGVNLMPGKPTALGVTPDGRALLGLPGYPVSCVVAAERFLAPLVAALLGTPPPARERVRAKLARKTASKVGH